MVRVSLDFFAIVFLMTVFGFLYAMSAFSFRNRLYWLHITKPKFLIRVPAHHHQWVLYKTYFSKFVSWQFVNVKAQLPFLIISHGRNFRFIVCVQWRMCRSCRCVVFGFFGSSLFRRFFPSGATTCFGLKKKRFVILKTGKSIVSKGQKISNGNCGVFNSPKKWTKGSLKIKVLIVPN